MKVLGIDEAGRGALIGPLVIAGFIIDDDKINTLKMMGVKDSKLLSKEKRESLYYELKKMGKYEIIKVMPQEIDQRFRMGTNLNDLEMLKMAEIINKLKPDKAILDSPHPIPEKFKAQIKVKIDHKTCEIISENKADTKYVVVGAASILAKVTRDRAIEEISKEYGNVGVGYPHDDKTLKFVRRAIKTGEGRQHVRKSWETYTRLKAQGEQKKLSDFK